MAGLGATGLERVLPVGTDVYVALYSTEVVITTESGTEVSDSGYARVAFDDWKTVVGASSIRRTNNTAIVFPAAVDGKVTVRWWAIWDADIGGNLIAAGPIMVGGNITEEEIGPGDQFRFDAETLSIVVEDGI
ncbi:MAG: hypothetical protein EKK62_16495 [Acidimicrobiia bacterium]|nr:MAG: hypothetical protein EKK62_16495 [Acidimicrobiia bacterium]